MPSQKIEVEVRNQAGSDVSRADKETRKQVKKQTEYAKEAEKVREKSALQQAGISFSLGSVLKQSQVFTSTIGSIFQLLGALVDVILAPFLPIVVPAIKTLASFIPKVAKYARESAEIAIPRIKEYLSPVIDALKKIFNMEEGGFSDLLMAIGKIIVDFVTKFLPYIATYITDNMDRYIAAASDFWDYLKNEIPILGTIETNIRNLWTSITEWKQKNLPWLESTENALSGALEYLGNLAAWLTTGGGYDMGVKALGVELENIGEFIEAVGEYIGKTITNLEDNITQYYSWFTKEFPKYMVLVKDLMWAVSGDFQKFFTGFGVDVKAIFEAFGDDLEYVFSGLGNIGSVVAEAITVGLHNYFSFWADNKSVSMKLWENGFDKSKLSLPGIAMDALNTALSNSRTANVTKNVGSGVYGFAPPPGPVGMKDNPRPGYEMSEEMKEFLRMFGRLPLLVGGTEAYQSWDIKDRQRYTEQRNHNMQIDKGVFARSHDIYGEDSHHGWM
tara:strand:- start:15774 stop:17279 length:1506 start_codon:yes stop_codon:yes gene_type:complete